MPPEGPVTDLNLGPAPVASANPIAQVGGVVGVMKDLSEIKNLQNTADLFKQTMAAQHEAGDNIAVMRAKGMSDDEILSKIKSSPNAMLIGPDLEQWARTGLTQAETRAKQQEISLTASKAITLMGAASTKDNLDAGYAQLKASLSQDPVTQKQADEAFKAYKISLTYGLPTDPAAAAAEYDNRKRDKAILFGGADPNFAFQVLPNAAGVALPATAVSGPGGQPMQIGGKTAGIPNVSGLQESSAINTGLGNEAVAYKKRMDDNVTLGNAMMKNLEVQDQALRSIETGGGATAWKNMAQVAHAVIPEGFTWQGMDKKALVDKIAGGDLTAATEFQKLAVGNIMGQIKQQLPSGSPLAVMEFNAFENNNPTLDTDKNAIHKIHDFWRTLQQQQMAEQKEMREYHKAGGDLAWWPQEWQKRVVEKGWVKTTPTGEAEPTAPAVRGERRTGSSPLVAGPTAEAPARPTPPEGAIAHLKANPELANRFDEKYGAGAAKKILGGSGGGE